MITIKEIAKAAGVSASTVSRALSGDKRVNEQTRRQIEKLALSLKYSPNYSAKALSGKQTHLIGIIVPEISSNYYAQMIDCIEAELYQRGYTLLVGTSGWDAEKGLRHVDIFIGRNVDGIIYADEYQEATNAFVQERAAIDRFPLVLLGNTGGQHNQECVLVDEGHGITLLMKHLAELGHRAIGFIGEDISSHVRLPLFHQALQQAGLAFNPAHIKAVGKERFEAGGYKRMNEMLQEDELPTAIFASYDYLAMGAIKAAADAGLRVPEDLTIVGFDNVRESAYLLPPLTTVCPPVMEMSQRAVQILIDKIENDALRSRPPATTTIYPELIIRQSSGPAPAL